MKATKYSSIKTQKRQQYCRLTLQILSKLQGWRNCCATGMHHWLVCKASMLQSPLVTTHQHTVHCYLPYLVTKTTQQLTRWQTSTFWSNSEPVQLYSFYHVMLFTVVMLC